MARYSFINKNISGIKDAFVYDENNSDILRGMLECDAIIRDKIKNNKELLLLYNELDNLIYHLNRLENEKAYIKGIKTGVEITLGKIKDIT